MTEDDAMTLIDFFTHRLHGWSVALSIDPKTGRADFRTRRTREVHEFERDAWLNSPGWRELMAAAVRGEDIIEQWPEEFRAALRFRLDHIIPRAINEPLSEEGRHHRQEVQGMPDWPEFLNSYAKPATVADHPPLPERSPLYRAWKRAA